MDEFIKLLDPAYELIQYRIKEDKVIFHIASKNIWVRPHEIVSVDVEKVR